MTLCSHGERRQCRTSAVFFRHRVSPPEGINVHDDFAAIPRLLACIGPNGHLMRLYDPPEKERGEAGQSLDLA